MKAIDLWLELFPEYEQEKGEYYPITFPEIEYALDQYKDSIPIEPPVILPKPTVVEPGQIWLSDKDFKYNQGYSGEIAYIVKSKEPDEPWICTCYQEWSFGGYERELTETEIKLMKYLGHIKDIRRRSK